MSSGYDITVTYRVDGAESVPEALRVVGIDRDPETGYRAVYGATDVEIVNVFPVRYNIRSLKDEHKP